MYDDPREAMEDGATFIHEKHPVAERGNLLTTVALDCGDVEKAFAEAAVVIENDYETPMVEHCYLEPDVCIAEPNPLTGGLTLTSPSRRLRHPAEFGSGIRHPAAQAACGEPSRRRRLRR